MSTENWLGTHERATRLFLKANQQAIANAQTFLRRAQEIDVVCQQILAPTNVIGLSGDEPAGGDVLKEAISRVEKTEAANAPVVLKTAK